MIRDCHAGAYNSAYTLARFRLAELHHTGRPLGAYLLRLALTGAPIPSLNRTAAQIAGKTPPEYRKGAAKSRPPAKLASYARKSAPLSALCAGQTTTN